MSDNAFKLPEVQVNTFKKSNPVTGKVIENTEKIVDSTEDNDVRHITIEVPAYHYLEGQSAGVLAPGENEKGKPHAPRLYSIASIGNDSVSYKHLELCVKRVVYQNDAGETVKGVCSNYLADLKAGDEVNITGPFGRNYLLPVEEERNRPYIFVATGTGIAPFRPMIKRLLTETPGFNSDVFLFFGGRYMGEMLYKDEFESYKQENFHYIISRSREQQTPDGKRLYVHHQMMNHEDVLLPVIKNPDTLIYICGLKGMVDGVNEALDFYAGKLGQNPEEFKKTFEGRILKEVY